MTTEKLKTNITCHEVALTDSSNHLITQSLSHLITSKATGRLACTTTQAPAKGGQVQDSERETNQLIKKTGLENQNAGLTHVTNLFPYSPISLFPCKRSAFTLAEVLNPKPQREGMVNGT